MEKNYRPREREREYKDHYDRFFDLVFKMKLYHTLIPR